MGLPYQTEDYDEGGGGGAASTVNDLGGMNFSTLSNNEIMKRVDANNVGGTKILNAATPVVSNISINTSTYHDGDDNLISSITHVKDDSIPANTIHKVNILPNALESEFLTILHSAGDAECRVGINVADPEEVLDIEGNLQLRSGAQGKIFFKHPSGIKKVELDGNQDGTNGGKFIVKTKVDGGSMTQKLEVNNAGAIGLGSSPDYGTAGNFLMSLGSGSLPEWFVPTVKIITSVKKTISQSFTSGGVDKITGWDTPHVDIGTTGWSNANSRYTIQRTATYRIDLKAIISNTGNDTSQLRYLNVGIYIYNSGGGAPVLQDLDTTVLVNVDNTGGNAERGSGDYTIIRTLTATQYIEFQVGSLQATGNYNIESAVFNIEEVSAYHVAGVGQFFTLTDGNNLQTQVNNLNNYTFDNTTDLNLKSGNNTGGHNNNTYGSWVGIYNQSNVLQLSPSITLSDITHAVKIETNIHARVDRTQLGFRIRRVVAGVAGVIVVGSEQWGRAVPDNVVDDDHFTYCISIVDVPGVANVTYRAEVYASDPGGLGNSFFEINAGIVLGGGTNNVNMLLTEL
jgi:hypothetical protein